MADLAHPRKWTSLGKEGLAELDSWILFRFDQNKGEGTFFPLIEMKIGERGMMSG